MGGPAQRRVDTAQRRGRTAKATANFKRKDFVNIQTNLHKIIAANEAARLAHIEALSKDGGTAQSTKKKPTRLSNAKLCRKKETEESFSICSVSTAESPCTTPSTLSDGELNFGC